MRVVAVETIILFAFSFQNKILHAFLSCSPKSSIIPLFKKVWKREFIATQSIRADEVFHSVGKSSRDMKYVERFEDLSQDYDVLLLDMWGVMHDGTKPYDGVINCVRRLKKNEKRLVILSNSSKRIDHSKKMLTKLGFDPETDFDDIITSGEVSFRLLSGDPTLPSSCKWSPISNMIDQASKQVLIFGSGDQDTDYVESAGWDVASNVESANLLVARGTFTFVQKNSPVISKKEDENTYNNKISEILELSARRKIPMLVCNPDKVRPDEGLPPMPGAIGDAYVTELVKQNADSMSKRQAEALVKRIGKPYQEVFDIALQKNSASTARSCMVGDALETDITGGSLVKNCDTIWVVNDGIHGPTVRQIEIEDGKLFNDAATSVLNEFNILSETMPRMGQEDGRREIKPTYVTAHFKW